MGSALVALSSPYLQPLPIWAEMILSLIDFVEDRPMLALLLFFLIGSVAGGGLMKVFTSGGGVAVTVTTVVTVSGKGLCVSQKVYLGEVVVEANDVYVIPLDLPCIGELEVRIESLSYSSTTAGLRVELVMGGVNGSRVIVPPLNSNGRVAVYRVIVAKGVGALVLRLTDGTSLRIRVTVLFEPLFRS